MKYTLLAILFLILLTPVFAQTPVQPVLPTLPQRVVDVSMPDTTGYVTVTVADTGNPTTNGQNLQNAVNAASCNPQGTIIYLQAGANYDVSATGGVVLPAKNCAPGKWIIIRSNAPDSQLPPEGVRIDPSYASLLPKIRKTTVNGYTFFFPINTRNYRLMFLEFTTTANSNYNSNTHIGFGDGSAVQDTLAEIPRYLIADRVYIHGDSTRGSVRGVDIECGDCAVINSYISDIHNVGQETQAVGGWNGDGPVLIDNNFLSAAGENIIFGGAVSRVPGVNPNDITITRNYFWLNPAWNWRDLGKPYGCADCWQVKNFFELKTGVRVLVEGNIFENMWDDGQDGSAFVIKTTNSVGASGPTWPLTSDITIRYNKVFNAEGGVGGSAGCYPDVVGSACTPRVLFQDNIFWEMGGHWSDRYMIIIAGAKSTYSPPTDQYFNHNTIITTDKWNAAIGDEVNAVIAIDAHVDAGQKIFERFAFHNNIMGWGKAKYGIVESCAIGGTSASCTTADSWHKNIFFDRVGCAHTNDVCTAGVNLTMNMVQFTDPANNNYKLLSTSPGKNAATDGKDVGADVDMVNLMTAGAVTGVWSGNYTPPMPAPDTTPPTLSNGQPTSVPSGSTQTTMSLSTNENANCKYSTTAGVSYASMPSTFSTTGSFSHSATISGLSDGNTYTYYVRCQDSAGNMNTADFLITFTVLTPPAPAAILLNTSLGSTAEVSTPNVGTGTGSSVNGATFVAGQIGNGVLIDAPGEYIRYQQTDGSVQNVELDRGTIEFWYRPSYNHNDGQEHNIFMIGGWNVPGSVLLWKRANNVLNLAIFPSSGFKDLDISTYSWTANQWVKIRVTWDSTVAAGTQAAHVYINGVEPAYSYYGINGPFSMPAESATSYIYIGNRDAANTNNAAGVIDELVIANAPLTPGQSWPSGGTPTCSGTPISTCITGSPPSYCSSSATVVNNCQACGCPSGQQCNATSSACYTQGFSGLILNGRITRTSSGTPCASCTIDITLAGQSGSATTNSAGDFSIVLANAVASGQYIADISINDGVMQQNFKRRVTV